MTKTKELMEFLDSSPTCFYTIKNIEKELIKYDFKRINNADVLKGKYYLIENEAGIIAIDVPEKFDKILLVSSHSDQPCLHIKTNAEIIDKGYIKLNVEPYGGLTTFTWFDRPLSISGRIIYKEDNKYITELINIDKDLCVIPSLCAHMSNYNTEGFKPNPQKELLPIIGIESDKFSFIEWLKDYTNKNVIDYDLYIYNRDKAKLIGLNDEFILSPRIDNLACAFGTLKGFLDSCENDVLKVYCCFNSEEIGSLTIDGADSNFLKDILEQVCHKNNVCLKDALNKSFMVSADNGHAYHPNYPEKNDVTNICLPNKGIMIKHHVNYTTNGLSSAIFKGILNEANVLYQDFNARSDTKNGSTLGKISINHVSVLSIDIGLSQLAMHSINETCGSKDIDYLIEGIKAYFGSKFEY